MMISIDKNLFEQLASERGWEDSDFMAWDDAEKDILIRAIFESQDEDTQVEILVNAVCDCHCSPYEKDFIDILIGQIYLTLEDAAMDAVDDYLLKYLDRITYGSHVESIVDRMISETFQ